MTPVSGDGKCEAAAVIGGPTPAVPWIITVSVGLAMLGLSVAGARKDPIPASEVAVFRALNHGPEWWYPVMWLPMQLGNLVVGTIVGGAVCLLAGEPWAAGAVVAAMVLKLVTERLIRHEMAPYLQIRRRPGESQPGAILRGDVSPAGPSFPSGHVLLAAACACVTAAVLPWPLDILAVTLAAIVAIGRVYVGAHNPLDVTAGFGAGLAIGGALTALLPG